MLKQEMNEDMCSSIRIGRFSDVISYLYSLTVCWCACVCVWVWVSECERERESGWVRVCVGLTVCALFAVSRLHRILLRLLKSGEKRTNATTSLTLKKRENVFLWACVRVLVCVREREIVTERKTIICGVCWRCVASYVHRLALQTPCPTPLRSLPHPTPSQHFELLSSFLLNGWTNIGSCISFPLNCYQHTQRLTNTIGSYPCSVDA